MGFLPVLNFSKHHGWSFDYDFSSLFDENFYIRNKIIYEKKFACIISLFIIPYVRNLNEFIFYEIVIESENKLEIFCEK